mmetsp:Transcript_8322/g.27251  ORF Transcript_8322/g.27251 Transcript_8322/m.27251 type:complete len:275 (-) Transcript_8322:446-1270(-)
MLRAQDEENRRNRKQQKPLLRGLRRVVGVQRDDFRGLGPVPEAPPRRGRREDVSRMDFSDIPRRRSAERLRRQSRRERIEVRLQLSFERPRHRRARRHSRPGCRRRQCGPSSWGRHPNSQRGFGPLHQRSPRDGRQSQEALRNDRRSPAQSPAVVLKTGIVGGESTSRQQPCSDDDDDDDHLEEGTFVVQRGDDEEEPSPPGDRLVVVGGVARRRGSLFRGGAKSGRGRPRGGAYGADASGTSGNSSPRRPIGGRARGSSPRRRNPPQLSAPLR